MVRLEPCLLWVLLVLTMYVMNACMATDCGKDVAYTINVDQKGNQNFTSIQKAVDSVPSGNNRWIRIFIFRGTYKEKVEIPKEKGCIYMEGEVEGETRIAWGDHGSVIASAAFTAYPDNIAVKNMAFENTYIISENPTGQVTPALAVRLQGDKYSFYKCKFTGLQDTLWDALGRHYFKQSSISGTMDFIWGFGQSIYEGCTLNVTLGALRSHGKHKRLGIITAQGRDSESETNGFVFKGCTVTGDRMLLGRAYRPYSRVIFYQSQLPSTLLPRGWDAWNSKGYEDKLTYVEAENNGPGASTSGRVAWMKKMNQDELNKLVSLSYIDQDGWISNLPTGALV